MKNEILFWKMQNRQWMQQLKWPTSLHDTVPLFDYKFFFLEMEKCWNKEKGFEEMSSFKSFAGGKMCRNW